MPDYRKLDGALATLLDSHAPVDEPLSVFVRTDGMSSEVAKASLIRHGIVPRESISVYAADLTCSQIRGLSDEPSVLSIRLARVARPLPLR